MHSSTTPSGTTYHHNGDYSGELLLDLPASKVNLASGQPLVSVDVDDILAIAARAEAASVPDPENQPPSHREAIRALTGRFGRASTPGLYVRLTTEDGFEATRPASALDVVRALAEAGLLAEGK